MERVYYFINLDKLCLKERGNAKAYENPNVFNAEHNKKIAEIRSIYGGNIDIDETYQNNEGETFIKVGVLK